MNSFIIAALMAPASISYHGNKAVFVDFTKAHYQINVAQLASGSSVTSEINLLQPEEGHIIFDLTEHADELYLDGVPANAESLKLPKDPITGESSIVKVLAQTTAAGPHTLTVKNKLKDAQHISFFSGGTELYFKMRDLKDRRFLEQYAVTNLEYDQYAITLQLTAEVKNPELLKLMTNATIITQNKNTWTIEYPEYFNCSSIFLHLFPSSKYQIIADEFIGASGKKTPITLYGRKHLNLKAIQEKVKATLAELDQDFGDFPHPQLIVYGQGMSGGMEYAGATESSLVSVGHELFHSYFGRGVLPANGSAGCLDEGLASWRDHQYFRTAAPQLETSTICAHGDFTRNTDSKSYHDGREFFAYADYMLQSQGGLKKFLRMFFQNYVHTVIKTDTFRRELLRFSNSIKLDEAFGKYLMGESK